MVQDIPEMLVDGHERQYLTWFYRYTCNPTAITKDDIDEYVSHYSAPGGMRAGFEYYRALFDDVKQNKEYSSTVKLPMPVLVLGCVCSFGTAALDSMRLLATDVTGGVVPDSGHWIAEERPDYLVWQLLKFFAAR
jgi:pimeloyl-ACP methyl ester carboxylesterase